MSSYVGTTRKLRKFEKTANKEQVKEEQYSYQQFYQEAKGRVESSVEYYEGEDIPTFKTDFSSCNILEVKVGTNGYYGGDAGYGSRTYFALRDVCGTCMETRLLEDGIELKLAGDCELDTFVASLEFALETLKRQISA